MGCDIHQYNFIYQTDGTWLFEGEGIGDFGKEYKFNDQFYEAGNEESFYSAYHSDYIPEIVPGRNYQLFGMLAEVRGDDYAIDDYYRHSGYPEPFVEDQASYVLTVDKHSPTWYTFQSLRDGCLSAIKEMKKDCAKYREEYVKNKKIANSFLAQQLEDVEWFRDRAEKIVDQLNEARKSMTGEQFRKSIILFDFDS